MPPPLSKTKKKDLRIKDDQACRQKQSYEKLIPGIVVLLVIHLSCFAQNIPGDRIAVSGEENELALELQNSKPGIPRIESILNLSAYYLFLPGEEKEDLDKAMQYAREARLLSSSVEFQDGVNEGMVLAGNMYAEKGNVAMSEIILDSAAIYIQTVRKQSQSLHQPEREARALRQMATIHVLKGDFKLAENELLEIIKIYQSNGFRHLHYTYQRLSSIYVMKGDYEKALFYTLEALRSMTSTGDNSSAGSFYFDLGWIYRNTGQFQKSLDYYERAFDFYKTKSIADVLVVRDFMSNTLTRMGKPQEALDLILRTLKEYPVQTNFEKKLIENNLGNCYKGVRQFELAEKHYVKLFELKLQDSTLSAGDYHNIGQLYVETRRYNLAKPYLDKAFELVSATYPARGMAHLHFLMYKADSAAGNYLSAMDHLMKNKAMDDKVITEAKIRQIQEMRIRYESETKDQDIRLKEKNILLLRRQAELQKKDLEQTGLKLRFETQSKEQSLRLMKAESGKKDQDLLVKQQNIELLRGESLLHQSRLQQTKTIRNMFVGGVIMLLLLLALGFNRYQLKQRANREINTKNHALQHLVDEKEWLLKEVHHRVKNNLQTVLSLLESQSRYLRNDALHAIQNSQNRVYAMSLIHKKLYQSTDVASINMEDYLRELVHHLRDSFGPDRVQFNLSFEPIELDVSQAVPIGLIVNEAITNSIKYAFPKKTFGNQITVSIGRSASKGEVELNISDNGIGLAEAYHTKESSGSLGLKLIKGLTEDIEGRFSMRSESGLNILIRFIANIPLRKMSGITLQGLVPQQA